MVARTGSWAGDPAMPAFQGMWPRWRQVMHRAGQRGALALRPEPGVARRRRAPGPRTSSRSPPTRGSPCCRALSARVRTGDAGGRQRAAAPRGWATEFFASLAVGVIEEVDFEGPAAWVAAGDTEFPGAPVRGVRLLPYFDAYAIAAGPREMLFPRTGVRACTRGRSGRELPRAAGRRCGGRGLAPEAPGRAYSMVAAERGKG